MNENRCNSMPKAQNQDGYRHGQISSIIHILTKTSVHVLLGAIHELLHGGLLVLRRRTVAAASPEGPYVGGSTYDGSLK